MQREKLLNLKKGQRDTIKFKNVAGKVIKFVKTPREKSLKLKNGGKSN